MARIPLGNAGNRMPGRVPTPAIAESGVAVGRALENLGGVGVDVGLQKERDRLAVQWEEDDKQKRAAAAAARAQDTAALLETEDRLRDLHDEVATGILQGTIPKDNADKEWGERSRKVLDEALPKLRDEARPLAQPRLTSVTNTLGNGIRKAKEKRDRQDVTVNLDGIFETAQRGYARDAAGMTALVEGAVASVGGQSNYTPEQLARKVQTWKEGAQFNLAFEAVSAGRNNPKALQDAEALIGTLADIDPQRRAVLQDRIAGYRMHMDQQRELAAQRAQRQSEAAMTKAKAAFDAATTLADKGVLAPEYAERTLSQLAGTPYQAAFSELVKQQAQTGSFAAQPVTVQRRALDALNSEIATQGLTPEREKRRATLSKVVAGSEADLKADPLRAGLERGVITELRPLDLAGGLPGIAEQLRERTAAATVVQQWAGRPVSPLTSDEAETLKQRMDTLPAKDRSTFIAAVSKAIGPQASAGLAQQLDGRDKALSLAFGYAGSQTTNGRFTSELILKGQQAKGDGTSTKGEKAPDVKAAGWKAYAAAELDGVFGNAQTTSQIRDAAELIMHGMASEAGGRLSKDDMERAVRLAVGGSLLEHNGRKIPLPAGVDADMLDKRLRTLTPEDIKAPGGVVRAAGVEVPVADFLKTLPGQQLMPVRPGQYAVIVNGRPVVMGNGDPVIVGVR